MSDANRTSLRFIEETTWNSLPGTPTMQKLRWTGESLNPGVENIISQEVRDDRMVSDLIQVSRSNQGGFDWELSYGTFDTLFQGALFGTWAADELKNGIVEYSYSIEKAHLDEVEFFLYTGMMVNTMTLNLATSSIASGSFEFLGSSCTLAQASNASTLTAATTTDVMNCMGNVASLKEGSTLTALTGIYVQELSLTINNNLRPVHAIGSNVIQEVAVGKQDLTGTLNCKFKNDRLFDQFLAGSASAIEFQIQDAAGNSYTVNIPNIKFETENIPAPGQDQDVIENITWRALYDSSEDAHIKITRASA
jgi:hypothetical protein